MLPMVFANGISAAHQKRGLLLLEQVGLAARRDHLPRELSLESSNGSRLRVLWPTIRH